jgi:hypothetical protein
MSRAKEAAALVERRQGMTVGGSCRPVMTRGVNVVCYERAALLSWRPFGRSRVHVPESAGTDFHCPRVCPVAPVFCLCCVGAPALTTYES